MPAQKYDFLIESGATFSKQIKLSNIDYTPINLTGCTIRMQIRNNYGGDILCDLTTENGRISTDRPNGIIKLKIDALTTSKMLVANGVYDLKLGLPNGDVLRVLEGSVTIKPEVTK